MLYIVGTPIGNLDDITLRALNILNDADLIIVESYNDSIKLLKSFDIHAEHIEVYNDSNKKKVGTKILDIIKGVDSAVYITSAGTPGVSDPGSDLVSLCLDAGVEVLPIPGASAFSTLVSVAGVNKKQLLFVGFFPKKQSKIKKFLDKLDSDTALIFYESKFRILKSLEVIFNVYPGAHCVIGREMTKKFEEYIRGSVKDVLDEFSSNKGLKGEFTVYVYLD